MVPHLFVMTVNESQAQAGLSLSWAYVWFNLALETKVALAHVMMQRQSEQCHSVHAVCNGARSQGKSTGPVAGQATCRVKC